MGTRLLAPSNGCPRPRSFPGSKDPRPSSESCGFNCGHRDLAATASFVVCHESKREGDHRHDGQRGRSHGKAPTSLQCVRSPVDPLDQDLVDWRGTGSRRSSSPRMTKATPYARRYNARNATANASRRASSTRQRTSGRRRCHRRWIAAVARPSSPVAVLAILVGCDPKPPWRDVSSTAHLCVPSTTLCE